MLKKTLSLNINSFILKLVYILFLLVLIFPYYRISDIPSAGIDNSWRIALEIAYQKGFVFGKDIIYTYGPLGRLTQRYAIATSNLEFFVFDLFCFASISLLLYYLLPKPLKLYQLLIHFVIFLLITSIYGEWLSFLIFYVSVFFGLKFLQTSNRWFLAYTVLMAIVIFYIKANYGIIALLFIVVLLLYAYFTKRISLVYTAIFGVGTVLILFMSAYALNTDLLKYLYASVQVIKGYNEAQSLFPDSRMKSVASSYLIFAVLVAVCAYFLFSIIRKKQFSVQSFDTLFLLGCVGVCNFVLLKYAFVRADDGHLMSFVRSASLVFLLLPAFAQTSWLKASGWVLFSLNFISYVVFYQPIYGKIQIQVTDNLRTKSYILPEYFSAITKTPTQAIKPFYPQDILNIIDNKSVDIVPNEITDIYFNKLNYNPRPVVQSYQAYNEFLDNKNKEKYLSNTAPDFVVYNIEGIDGKYAWGDETQTLLGLLQNYEPVKVFDGRLLLQKSTKPKTLELQKQRKTSWELGKPFNLVADTLENQKMVHLIKVKASYNITGKLLNFFFQPPHLSMNLLTEAGENSAYQTMPTLLNKGLIVNAKIDSVENVKQFFETLNVANKGLRSISFDEIVRYRNGFNKNIEITEEWYVIKF